MPHVTLKEVLTKARQGNYGVLSLLGADMQMALGLVQGAEDKRAPLILVYNQEVTPQIPMEVGVPLLVNLAERSSVRQSCWSCRPSGAFSWIRMVSCFSVERAGPATPTVS